LYVHVLAADLMYRGLMSMLLLSNWNHSRRSSAITSGEREVRPVKTQDTEEDVAASKIWQKTEDGEADDFHFFPGDVMVLVLNFPKAACFESAVEDRSPTII
jgi:hypothetical protein